MKKNHENTTRTGNWFTNHLRRSVLLTVGLCLFSQTPCLAAAPQEFKFTVKRFSVDGLLPFPQAFVDDYFKPLQNRPYTLKELQGVSKGLEQVIRSRGYPLYRVMVPPQSLDSGEIKLQVVTVKALNCKVPLQ
jgi:hemolysin activation/secretion protein